MKNFTRPGRAMLLFVLLLAGVSSAFSQQIEKSLTMTTGEKVGFLEYKPKNYATEGNVKHPVIIFLHGIGERGNGTTELKNVARIGLPRMIRDGHTMTFTWNGKTETFLVVSPQCPSIYGMWPQKMVDEFVSYVKKELRSDTNRIYLTGLSMGGGGSNRYISTYAQFPKRVSAVATVCTPCTFDNGQFVADAKLPFWAFHAADDSVALASCTDRAINRINSANPQVKPLRTIWPTGGHAVWDRVYADTNYTYGGILNIYEWFLGQNKSLPVNKIPVANAGVDQRVSPTLPSVTLNGSASNDADGKLVRYVWKKISGPGAGKIAAPMSASSSTTITGLTITGTYKYELAVVDDRAGFSKDTVSITVAADAPVPVIDTVVKSADTVKSTIPVVTTPLDTVKPTIPVKPTDTVKATMPVTTSNKPPIAATSGDIVVPLEWNWAPSVSGWPSKDPDGWIALFTWEKVSGPDSYKIVSPKSVRTQLQNLVEGVYVFRVTAFDNKGASSFADVKVTMTRKQTQQTVTTASKAIVEEVAAVPVTVLSMPAQVTVSPNPAVNMVNLQYTSGSTGKSFINVYDASGKLIKNITFYKPEGLYKHNLDISQLISGVYYVQIQTGNAVQLQTKFVKR
ncbi:MAG: T9SS type A sorting domain-containing protein [Chitinophagaceae bacterium]|nr:T9SS type A sorting domain-containing protein [Chitinophagaceae bacterium]